MKGASIATFKKLKDFFDSRKEVILAYVLDSKSSGKSRDSNFDIAIYVDGKIPKINYPWGYQESILKDIKNLLKIDKIELVLLNESPTIVKSRVVCFGRLIFFKSEKDKEKFQQEVMAKGTGEH